MHRYKQLGDDGFSISVMIEAVLAVLATKFLLTEDAFVDFP